ncbi:MAG: Zn-dependent hydrolase [Spirochaetia bacterium]
MIDIKRLMDDIETMAAIGARPDGGLCREALSPADLEGRAYLRRRMEAAGLSVRVDAAGNIIGRREADAAGQGEPGAAPTEAATVVLGSHIDTIERGGKYDGTVGVLGALECVRTLADEGVRLRRPVEVIAFTDEEERFLGFLGSYAFTGSVDTADLAGVRDRNGIDLVDAMREVGLEPDRIAEARRDPAEIHAFLELHIEQGPVLERDGASIGVVERVKGDYRWEISVEGRTDHAGAPLDGRRDAFMAMHEVVAAMIEYRDRLGDPDTTLTVGRMDLRPNVETAQPGWVQFSLDIRSPGREVLIDADRALRRILEEVAERTGQKLSRQEILIEDPVPFHGRLLDVIRAAADDLGYTRRDMQSGAGHDAQILGRHVPSAMIFVPSVDGRSHCPEEHTSADDIERGVNVLCETLRALAGAQ